MDTPQWYENDEGRIINLGLVRFFHKKEGKIQAVFDKDYVVSAMPAGMESVEEAWAAIKIKLGIAKKKTKLAH